MRRARLAIAACGVVCALAACVSAPEVADPAYFVQAVAPLDPPVGAHVDASNARLQGEYADHKVYLAPSSATPEETCVVLINEAGFAGSFCAAEIAFSGATGRLAFSYEPSGFTEVPAGFTRLSHFVVVR